MKYASMLDFVTRLEEMGELQRIEVDVSTVLEITEIADRMVKGGGPALLFTSNGTRFPLLINAFASDRRMAAALGVESLDEIAAHLDGLMQDVMRAKDAGLFGKMGMLPRAMKVAAWMPKRMPGRRGACQEVVMERPDLTQLPVLTCWPCDGGPFITLPLVHTRDPETGQQNTGMYRMQVYDKLTTGMHWHLHKDGAAHYRRYRDIGKKMPVTVTLGGDPVHTYASTAPLPPIIDEAMLSGFIRKRGVRLVKSLTNDIWIPEDSDIVIEGYVDPAEELRIEGPFGDHTGFYSLADLYPVFHVTAITHRRHAIYPATIVGVPPQEDLWLGKATGKIFLMPIRKAIAPEVTGMHMPAEGVFHNLVLTSIEKQYPGQAEKVASALWGAGQMMFNKIIALFDRDVDTEDYPQVFAALSECVDPATDIFFNTGPLDVLDHASRTFAYGSKMGIDATRRRSLPPATPPDAGKRDALLSIRGVVDISEEPVLNGTPLLMVFVDKQALISMQELHANVAAGLGEINIRFVFYLDSEARELPLSACLWLVAGNIDPRRDFIPSSAVVPVAGIDATRKTLKHDGFTRDWPNLTLMNRAMIQHVDARWPDYGLGGLRKSPSLPFLPYQQGEEAVASSEKK
jgi:4-hydroxy-3-polyprenylbenzoate decarboxylase